MSEAMKDILTPYVGGFACSSLCRLHRWLLVMQHRHASGRGGARSPVPCRQPGGLVANIWVPDAWKILASIYAGSLSWAAVGLEGSLKEDKDSQCPPHWLSAWLCYLAAAAKAAFTAAMASASPLLRNSRSSATWRGDPMN